jgi:hypothetical protein
MPQDTRLPAPEPVTPRAGLLARLRAEVRRHAIAYAVVLAFLVIGPVLVHLIFPDASLLVELMGRPVFCADGAPPAVPDAFSE